MIIASQEKKAPGEFGMMCIQESILYPGIGGMGINAVEIFQDASLVH